MGGHNNNVFQITHSQNSTTGSTGAALEGKWHPRKVLLDRVQLSVNTKHLNKTKTYLSVSGAQKSGWVIMNPTTSTNGGFHGHLSVFQLLLQCDQGSGIWNAMLA